MSDIAVNWSLQTHAYERALKTKKIQKFIGLDDTLFIFPLIRALSNCNIETIGLQHGVFDKKSIGYCESKFGKPIWYDKVIFWDELWKDVFLRNNPWFEPKNAKVGFSPEIFNIDEVDSKKKPSSDFQSLYVLYDSFCDTKAFTEVLKRLIIDGYHLNIKLRPGVSDKVFREMYVFSDKEWLSVTTHQKIDLGFVKENLAIIGLKTSLLYHLHFLNIPIWIIDFDMHYLDDLRGDDRFTFIHPNVFLDGKYLELLEPRKQGMKINFPAYPSLLSLINHTYTEAKNVKL